MMGNIVKELKKGNHTLTLKVTNLEQENKILREERNKLKLENYELKNKLLHFEQNKKTDEHALINFFGSMFSNMADVVIKSMESDSDE